MVENEISRRGGKVKIELVSIVRGKFSEFNEFIDLKEYFISTSS